MLFRSVKIWLLPLTFIREVTINIMDILKQLKEELNIRLEQVEAAVKLIDEGNTIPFIARYRKEVTGSLDDEQLRNPEF